MQFFQLLLVPLTNFKNLSKLSKFNEKDENDVFWALKDLDLNIKGRGRNNWT